MQASRPDPRTAPPASTVHEHDGGRLTIVGTGRAVALEDFAASVREGLTAEPKHLSCAWLYDRKGSLLFEEICGLPEYYLTRAEEEILHAQAAQIVADRPADLSLVELGSGSAVKTRILIDELLRQGDRLLYVPIDISRSMLEHSSRALLDDHAGLEVLGLAMEYHDGLHELRRRVSGPKLVLWLGSNAGNFDRAAAASFLSRVRADLDPEDRMLLGIDLRKDRRTLELAYDDPGGATARFNLNLLERINRELGGDFDVSAFRHSAVYDPALGRMEMNLVSRCAQRVRIETLGLEVGFAEGEAIHTEDSYKYSLGEIDDLARAAGFQVGQQWFDSRRRFSVNRLVPIA